jgi:hypothetical protein
VRNESEFRRENPPFAVERQVTALHISKSNILPAADFSRVFSESPSQSALALGSSFGCLTDVNELSFEIEGVNPTGLWPYASAQRKKGLSSSFSTTCTRIPRSRSKSK